MSAVPPTASGEGSDPLAATAFDPESEKVRVGASAGEYKIEEHVGAGAMGDVYRATHPVIGKQVAIKVIKRRLASSPEAVERFIREAKAVNRVSHPNVLDVFAMGKLDDGRLFLAMDFLDGESLGRRLRREGPMKPERVLEVLRPVCDALTAAHAQRVIHRDLKSDNIFICGKPGENERVYVLDFGIAKVLADVAASAAAPGAAKGTLTSEGSWIGTPAYMAPEQWTAEGASVASDVYSLGIVAYEMLAGRPPFTGSSLPAIMEQHFRAEPPAFSTVSARVPPGMEAAIARALSKKPEDRPAGAQAFLAELEAGLGGRARAVSARPDHEPRRRKLVAGLAGVALVAGALTVYVVLRGRDEGRAQVRPSAGPVPSDLVRLSVSSVPSAARVTHLGKPVGLTPLTLRFAPGEKVELVVARAGYLDATRQMELASDDKNIEVVLDPVRGFEGMWKIPTGELRVFERTGDQVAAYGLDDPAGERRFLRFFEFEPDLERVVFTATEEVVDPRAPNAASCHIRLVGEYRYDPAPDKLELRRQTVDYVLDGGQCVLRGAPRWTEFEPAQRLASAEGVTSASSQGASTVVTAYSPARQAPTTRKPTPPSTEKPIVSPDATKGRSKQNKAPPPVEVQKNIPKQKNVAPPQQKAEPQQQESGSALPAAQFKK